MTVVYGLYSSRDNELRYVGQTTQMLERRLAQHRNYAKRKMTAVHKWFLREVTDGFVVSIKPLVLDAVFSKTEQETIAHYRASGARLLNLTDGGEGTKGWLGNRGIKRPDLSERNRMNAGKKGHPMSPENKVKLIAALKGLKRPYLVLRNKTQHPWIGRRHSEETKARMRAAWELRRGDA